MGCQVTMPTLIGKIHLAVPPDSQSGQRQRIRGKGLPNKMGGMGDLYAIFNVVMPRESDADMQQLWKELAAKAAFDPRLEWSQKA